jgi:hypothetical protein
MLHDRHHRPILLEEAAELATGGGAALAPVLAILPDPPAAAAEIIEDPAAAADPARKPTLLEQARAAFQSKAGLLAEANAAQLQLADSQRLIATLQGEKAQLANDLAGVRLDLAALRTEQAEIAALLDTAKATAATAEEKAVDLVAAVGFPAASMPGADAEPEDSVETLTAKLAATTDSTARWTISRKISALRWK